MRQFKIFLAAHLEAQVMRLRNVSLVQHQRMMLPLLQPAEVDHIGRSLGDDEAEHGLVEECRERSRSVTVSATWLQRMMLKADRRYAWRGHVRFP